jgi:hypothetical protein
MAMMCVLGVALAYFGALAMSEDESGNSDALIGLLALVVWVLPSEYNPAAQLWRRRPVTALLALHLQRKSLCGLSSFAPCAYSKSFRYDCGYWHAIICHGGQLAASCVDVLLQGEEPQDQDHLDGPHWHVSTAPAAQQHVAEVMCL